jgi:hypothetical protein
MPAKAFLAAIWAKQIARNRINFWGAVMAEVAAPVVAGNKHEFCGSALPP